MLPEAKASRLRYIRWGSSPFLSVGESWLLPRPPLHLRRREDEEERCRGGCPEPRVGGAAGRAPVPGARRASPLRVCWARLCLAPHFWDVLPFPSCSRFPLRRTGCLLPVALREISRCWEEIPGLWRGWAETTHAGGPRDRALQLKQSDNTFSISVCKGDSGSSGTVSERSLCAIFLSFGVFFPKSLKYFLTSALDYTTI